ncbi:membrane-associated tyrosine- and threonine-specific cdc2-inhibitory kinase [Chanos chanos]|uniref:non-specific serine/threonine protein kinase n=1 Tax=Chanos chanos TaxID=29144 RepID=A0A6J2VGB0_CHACN|nr:membrane-associated tyrosine- and threonine-specific cdc2-inhibitory kinase [Chanos chanos]
MSVCQDKIATTPLPVPVHFDHAQQSFSLKKRRLPFSSSNSSSSLSPPRPLSHSLPPRPPSKGCPPFSRVFPQRPSSPWTPLSQSLIKNPPPHSLYDPRLPQSFFSQCFTNLGLIGRGSFGEVYKVMSHLDGHQYAVKRSVQRFRGNGERARSVREARNHERLCPHPHILDFVAAWEEGGRLYIQTELCCTSLLLHVETQPPYPDESSAWTYLCDLLSALRHLHSRGFAHLDLKPANVFLTRSGRLKLGDFGLLMELSSESSKEGTEGEKGIEKENQDVQEGDPRYMAPELLKGEYGPAADVFSLGVSILEVACNMEVPKGGEGWQQLRQGYLPTEFTNALSTELQCVLRLMLAPEPRDRATVEELLALPSVQKHRWRRQVSLYLRESLLSLLNLCQSLLSAGWKLLSYLNLPFVPDHTPLPPCTPPRDSWERDGEMSTLYPSILQSESGSPSDDPVFLPEILVPEHSPTFSHRIQSRLSVGSTSTPLPDSNTHPYLSPSLTPTHTHSLLDTPSSIHSNGSRHTLTGTPNLSPLHTGSLCGSPRGSAQCSQSLDHHCRLNSSGSKQSWIRPEPFARTSFEPKNLLSLFDETTLESEP